MPDPAVDVHGHLPFRDGDDLAEGVEGGDGAVELAAAVVGDDETIEAVLDG